MGKWSRGRTIAIGWLVVAAFACGSDDTPPPGDPAARVAAACGSCHPTPDPDVLPRGLWRTEVERMAAQIDILLPEADREAARFDVDAIATWYEQNAPEQLEVAESLTVDEPLPLRMRRRQVLLGAQSGPGVATIRRLDGAVIPGFDATIASANMATGAVHLFSLEQGPRLVGSSGHPARVAPADLDGDGHVDLVISDLGSPMPTEEAVGRVVVARNDGDGSFGLSTALEGIGRVADAQPADLDGDGIPEILVASFGGSRVGGVYVLVNESGDAPNGEWRFRAVPVSERTGAVSIVPFAGDAGAAPGFAVAFANQHEMVSLFRLAPGGFAAGFEEEVVYRAPHPNWGMSNLEAVDLDGDGDLDFLLAHGDTLDDGLAFKPYHGVQWLENEGGHFRAHEIGPLYGAHRAEAGDLDGDGDLDVVAAGFVPQVQLPVPPDGLHVDSVIWFEQTPGGWIPRAIEKDHPRHTGMTLADVDGDGRLDVVAGINQAWDLTAVENGASLEVWFNEGPAGDGAR